MLDTKSTHFAGYGGMDYGSINSKNPEAYIAEEAMDAAVEWNSGNVPPSDPLVAVFYSGNNADGNYSTEYPVQDFKLVHHNAGTNEIIHHEAV